MSAVPTMASRPGKLASVETVLCPYHGQQMADEEGWLVEWLES